MAARHEGRSLASSLGFSTSGFTLIATAISEVARNILEYSGRGEIRLSVCQRGGRLGICVVACDKGPGIADVAQAMEDGFTTGSGLGLGLGGARRLVNDFSIDSQVGQGTRVTVTRWR